MERGLIAQIDAHDQRKFGVTCWYLEKPVKKGWTWTKMSRWLTDESNYTINANNLGRVLTTV